MTGRFKLPYAGSQFEGKPMWTKRRAASAFLAVLAAAFAWSLVPLTFSDPEISAKKAVDGGNARYYYFVTTAEGYSLNFPGIDAGNLPQKTITDGIKLLVTRYPKMNCLECEGLITNNGKASIK